VVIRSKKEVLCNEKLVQDPSDYYTLGNGIEGETILEFDFNKLGPSAIPPI